MTAHPIDTEALRNQMRRAVATAEEDGSGAYIDPRDLAALLDALDTAEHRATRAEVQSETRRLHIGYWQGVARGNAIAADVWKESAEEAGARIKAWAQQYDYDMGLENDRADAAEARIKAVREMHKRGEVMAWQEDCTNPEAHDCMDDPHGGGMLCTDEILGHYCHGCAPEDAADVTEYPWPCPTIRALDV